VAASDQAPITQAATTKRTTPTHSTTRSKSLNTDALASSPQLIANHIRLQKPAAAKRHNRGTHQRRLHANHRDQQASNAAKQRYNKTKPSMHRTIHAVIFTENETHCNEEGRPEGRPCLLISVRREHYAAVTFSACQPLGPLTTLKVTA
jgi:hypothetical protein